MSSTMKSLMTMGAVLIVAGCAHPMVPVSLVATDYAKTCQVNEEVWDGNSGYMETEFASVTGARDGVPPVAVASLWDGSSGYGYSDPEYASATGKIEDGLPPVLVAGLWDGSSGYMEKEYASATGPIEGAPSSPVVALKSHETPCRMAN